MTLPLADEKRSGAGARKVREYAAGNAPCGIGRANGRDFGYQPSPYRNSAAMAST